MIPVPKLHGDVGDARLAGVAVAVAVLIQPDQVADGSQLDHRQRRNRGAHIQARGACGGVVGILPPGHSQLAAGNAAIAHARLLSGSRPARRSDRTLLRLP